MQLEADIAGERGLLAWIRSVSDYDYYPTLRTECIKMGSSAPSTTLLGRSAWKAPPIYSSVAFALRSSRAASKPFIPWRIMVLLVMSMRRWPMLANFPPI